MMGGVILACTWNIFRIFLDDGELIILRDCLEYFLPTSSNVRSLFCAALKPQ